MPFVSKKKLNKMIEQLIKANELLQKQDRFIKSLNNECKHLRNYSNFLEGCIKNRVDVDFPNSTVRKGGNTDNTGNKFY